jgi:hypothetical protein
VSPYIQFSGCARALTCHIIVLQFQLRSSAGLKILHAISHLVNAFCSFRAAIVNLELLLMAWTVCLRETYKALRVVSCVP